MWPPVNPEGSDRPCTTPSSNGLDLGGLGALRRLNDGNLDGTAVKMQICLPIEIHGTDIFTYF